MAAPPRQSRLPDGAAGPDAVRSNGLFPVACIGLPGCSSPSHCSWPRSRWDGPRRLRGRPFRRRSTDGSRSSSQTSSRKPGSRARDADCGRRSRLGRDRLASYTLVVERQSFDVEVAGLGHVEPSERGRAPPRCRPLALAGGNRRPGGSRQPRHLLRDSTTTPQVLVPSSSSPAISRRSPSRTRSSSSRRTEVVGRARCGRARAKRRLPRRRPRRCQPRPRRRARRASGRACGRRLAVARGRARRHSRREHPRRDGAARPPYERLLPAARSRVPVQPVRTGALSR